MNNKLEVIGIDHGWSMMKTISQVFVTGVKEITTTPALFGDVLEYEGKFYKVGTVRQEVKDTKVEDDSFYLLTLAAVAKELKRRGLAEAKVFLAVGLPLTRFGAEKNDFIKYLTKNKRVSFKYENESYHIEIDDVAVFPQCYAAVVDKIPAMAKKTLIVDIGSWTIDIMPVINKSPDESKCVTIPKGLITCIGNTSLQITRGSQEATYKATTLEKTVDIVDGKKTVTKTLTLDRGTMNSEYRSIVASNGVVTQEVAAYTKHASASTTVIDYTNATSSTKNVAAAKAISDSNLKKGITFVKNTASAVSDTSAYLKASDDTQRNTVITNLVKKNYFMSQVDKYIYKYDVNKNEGYILGDLGKKSTKVWNIVTAD